MRSNELFALYAKALFYLHQRLNEIKTVYLDALGSVPERDDGRFLDFRGVVKQFADRQLMV